MGEPWFPVPVEAWPDIADALEKPWPRWAVRMDLRWWADRERMGRASRPGRPTLCARWGWGSKKARLQMKAVEEWADPKHGDPDPDKGKPGGKSEGPARGQPGASEGPAGGQDLHRKCAPSLNPGASEGPAGGQRGASEGPHARNTQDTGHRTQALALPLHCPTGEPASPPEPPEAPSADAGSSGKPDKDNQSKEAWVADLWSQLDAIRQEHTEGARPLALTDKRRTAIKRAARDLRRAGLDRDALLRAAEWVHTSQTPQAEGARATGNALRTLLRPSHVVEYCEMSRESVGIGTSTTGRSRAAADTAWQQVERNLRDGGREALAVAPVAIRAAFDAAGGYMAYSRITHPAELARFRSAFTAAYRPQETA